jgi:hypothetical protein
MLRIATANFIALPPARDGHWETGKRARIQSNSTNLGSFA